MAHFRPVRGLLALAILSSVTLLAQPAFAKGGHGGGHGGGSMRGYSAPKSTSTGSSGRSRGHRGLRGGRGRGYGGYGNDDSLGTTGWGNNGWGGGSSTSAASKYTHNNAVIGAGSPRLEVQNYSWPDKSAAVAHAPSTPPPSAHGANPVDELLRETSK